MRAVAETLRVEADFRSVALAIEITLGPSKNLRSGVRSVWVYVSDTNFEQHSAAFDYAVSYLNDLREDDQVGGAVDPTGPAKLKLWRVSIQRPGTYFQSYGEAEEFTLSRLRELPLQVWESAAREHLTFLLGVELFQSYIRDQLNEAVPLVLHDFVLSAAEQKDLAAQLVARKHPNLIPGAPDYNARTYESHVRLALTAAEYADLLRKGRKDPSGEIARVHGVSPGTARSWVHRARQAGYLGKSIGRTAGQRRDVLPSNSKEPE